MPNHKTIAPLVLAIGVSAMLAAAVSISSAQQVDRITGLVREAGWQVVQANCTECHSAQLIAQNSGSRAVWKSRIVWMRETQGLGPLSSDVEDTILDYLTANYGRKAATRSRATGTRRSSTSPATCPSQPPRRSPSSCSGASRRARSTLSVS